MRQIFALTLMVMASGCATQAASEVRDAELSLSGVSLGDTEQAVISRLGPPEQTVQTGEGIELKYPGLTVSTGWLEQEAPGLPRRVYELAGTGTKACTPAGVCPGMPISAAIAHYGQPLRTERETGTFLEYYSAESSCWLQLKAATGTVESIRVVCQP